MPLLALYTGARLNELCKLRVRDVRNDEEILYIDINTYRHNDNSVDPGVKTSASSRGVPVHGDLDRFGFSTFVDACRRAGYERLFPELKPDAYGKLSGRFGKHFARFLKSIGIKRDKASANRPLSVAPLYATVLRLSSHSRSSIDNLIQEVLKLRSTPVASSQRFARGNCRQSRSASSSALTS